MQLNQGSWRKMYSQSITKTLQKLINIRLPEKRREGLCLSRNYSKASKVIRIFQEGRAKLMN